jgi:hypothetical protein
MDLVIIEQGGNGGDLVLKNRDLVTIEGWMNMPYLAMFGGNLAGVTKEKLSTEQAVDWWCNNLLMPNDSSVQFNSLLEKRLQEVALTSEGRIKLQETVQKDLQFMKDFAEISVEVVILSTDKVKISIFVRQPSNLQGRIADQYRAYIFIWDGTLLQIGDFSSADFNNEFFDI